MRRRRFLAAGAVAACAPLLAARAQGFNPAQDIRPLVDRLARGTAPRPGGIEIELPQIAENGNTVPLRVRIASPMSASDHVKAIHVLAERNPRPHVATFHLGPASGRADVSTRVRLAGAQKVTVLAELSDGSFRIAEAPVQVTAGACLDESL